MAVVIDEYGHSRLDHHRDLLESGWRHSDEYDTDDAHQENERPHVVIGGMAYLDDIEDRCRTPFDRHSDDYETLTGHITFNWAASQR